MPADTKQRIFLDEVLATIKRRYDVLRTADSVQEIDEFERANSIRAAISEISALLQLIGKQKNKSLLDLQYDLKKADRQLEKVILYDKFEGWLIRRAKTFSPKEVRALRKLRLPHIDFDDVRRSADLVYAAERNLVRNSSRSRSLSRNYRDQVVSTEQDIKKRANQSITKALKCLEQPDIIFKKGAFLKFSKSMLRVCVCFPLLFSQRDEDSQNFSRLMTAMALVNEVVDLILIEKLLGRRATGGNVKVISDVHTKLKFERKEFQLKSVELSGRLLISISKNAAGTQ